MGVDRHPDPSDDIRRTGDEIQDARSQEHTEFVAGDAEPKDPRTRKEHADKIPPPGVATPRNSDSADQRDSMGQENPRDKEEASPSAEDDSSKTEDFRPPGDARVDDPEGGKRQEEPSEETGIQPDTAAEYGNYSTGDPSNDPHDHDPIQESDKASGPDAPPYEPNMSTPSLGNGAAPESDGGRPIDDETCSLTDREWAEHITEVRDGLSKAYEQNLNTDCAYTINGAGEVWLEERERLHDAILEDLYARAADVPCDFKAIVAGGLGGAGKTTVLTQHAGIDLSQYLMINPDNIKEELARRGMIPEIDGLSPMEASDLAHEESSHLAKRLAHRAQADGKNLIWDITMSSETSTAGRIDDLRKANYAQVDGLFVDISVETSISRTEWRHREGHDEWRAGRGLGGRYVPPEIVKNQADSQWGSKNRKIYESMKGSLDSWSTYDNSVDGRPAEIIELGQEKTHNLSSHPERF